MDQKNKTDISHGGMASASAWLNAVVDSADDAIIGKDLDGVVQSWNRAAQNIFGYRAEEMIGQSILRLIPPDLHGEEAELLAKVRAGVRIHHYETTRLRKDGSPVQVSLTVSPVRDADGKVIGASKVARDITLQRQTENTLAHFAAIVESSDDAIISKDLNGIITSWNPAAERLYGWRAAEIIGRSVMKIIPPDLEHEEAKILGSIMQGEKIDHFETVRITKGGQRVEVSLTVSPVRNAAGSIIGASKIARAIGQQRAGERAQAMLAAIVQSSDDAIISKDLFGKVTSWNLGAERLYGYLAEEMIGHSILKVLPPDLRHEEDTILARIRSGERIQHYETTRLRKNGTKVEVSLTVSPIYGPSGKIVGASKIARDISQQREAQKQKDNFLAVLAHELRNPLAPVRTAISLFAQPGLPPEKLENVRRIAERQITHMATLLDDLLDVTRLTTGRVELKRERVEVAPLVEHAVEAAKPLIDSRNHELRVELSDKPIWLNADAVRVSQMVTNLLTNAAKYTDAGGQISVSVRGYPGEVAIEVADNGIGFSGDARHRLFKLFAQDREAIGRSQGGLGIGLALVKDFAERHGGSIDAASPGPGQGSKFTLRLPTVD